MIKKRNMINEKRKKESKGTIALKIDLQKDEMVNKMRHTIKEIS